MKMKADLPQFTGLRGIAALLVLFFHLRTPIGIDLTFGVADLFSKYGYLGVDIFFVLSGFILSHVYAEQFSQSLSSKSLRAFAVARFSRIYPLHFLTTILMLLAYGIALRVGVTPTESGGYSPTSLILGLLLVQEWFGVVAPNPGSWSISIELLNYIAFPFLIFISTRLPRYWPALAIILGTVVAALPANTNVLHGVAEFVMGCAAYAASKQHKGGVSWPLSGAFFALPFFVFYAFNISNIHNIGGFGLPALSFTAAVYFLAMSNKYDPFARLCTMRPLVFIGEISYSMYLLQWFVWVGWKHVIGKLPFFSSHPYGMVTLAAASLFILSVVSFYFFEKPSRSWLRRLLS
jgi:peptidoglycan/LPS O-acetylase OafA/YrhL